MVNSVRKICWNTLHDGFAALGFGIASYRQPSRVPVIREVRRLKRSREMLLTPLEANQIFSLVRNTSKVKGAMAEVGVYRGASARLIREADSRRELHLFDTFEGLPEPDDTDAEFRMGKFEKGQFSCSLQSVKNYVGNAADVHFHQGLFPSSAECVAGERFSFVHSDVDLYESTRSVLEFFYPRMAAGGVIVSHDYFSCQGPRKAFDEFFSGLPEPLIELPGDQIMAVKLSAAIEPQT